MRKLVLFFILLAILQIPVYSANKKMIPTSGGENDLPNIFIYSIPDDTTSEKPDKEDTDAPESAYVDNVKTDAGTAEEEITLNMEQEDDTSGDSVAYGATILKGYAQYVEDTNSIYLKDDDDNFILNLKKPQKISASKSLNLSSSTDKKGLARKYEDSEYQISPKDVTASATKGNFTIGAIYSDEVDNIAMLESETGLFTKYEKEHFALSSSFKKSLNTTYAQDYNTISVTPELKINSYVSLKNNLQADITRNRRSSELVLSLNPFGKKDTDRMRLEAGAKQTYYADTGENKTQLNFSATFKL